MLKNDYTYTYSANVPYYQCDVNGNMKLSYILRLVERAAGDHLEFLDLPYEVLYSEGVVFLLAKLGLKILRCPTWADSLVIETSPLPVRGAQFGRQVLILSEDGERLVEVHTIWLMVDPQERKILRPEHFRHPLPACPSEEQITPYAAQRIRSAGEVIYSGQHRVSYSNLDVNRHLNNTVYGDITTDSVPYQPLVERGVESFVINYQHEALIGEVIDITTQSERDGEYYVTGRRGKGDCFTAKLTLAPKDTASAHESTLAEPTKK